MISASTAQESSTTANLTTTAADVTTPLPGQYVNAVVSCRIKFAYAVCASQMRHSVI